MCNTQRGDGQADKEREEEHEGPTSEGGGARRAGGCSWTCRLHFGGRTGTCTYGCSERRRRSATSASRPAHPPRRAPPARRASLPCASRPRPRPRPRPCPSGRLHSRRQIPPAAAPPLRDTRRAVPRGQGVPARVGGSRVRRSCACSCFCSCCRGFVCACKEAEGRAGGRRGGRGRRRGGGFRAGLGRAEGQGRRRGCAGTGGKAPPARRGCGESHGECGSAGCAAGAGDATGKGATGRAEAEEARGARAPAATGRGSRCSQLATGEEAPPSAGRGNEGRYRGGARGVFARRKGAQADRVGRLVAREEARDVHVRTGALYPLLSRKPRASLR